MIIFLRIKGFICIIFALAILAFPTVVAPLYDLNLTTSGYYFGHLFGVCILGIGLLCLATSRKPRTELTPCILMLLAVTDTIGFGYTLYHQLSGEIGSLGWSTVALWAVFAVGAWYFRFRKSV